MEKTFITLRQHVLGWRWRQSSLTWISSFNWPFYNLFVLWILYNSNKNTTLKKIFQWQLTLNCHMFLGNKIESYWNFSKMSFMLMVMSYIHRRSGTPEETHSRSRLCSHSEMFVYCAVQRPPPQRLDVLICEVIKRHNYCRTNIKRLNLRYSIDFKNSSPV